MSPTSSVGTYGEIRVQPSPALEWAPPEGEVVPFSRWGGSVTSFQRRLFYDTHGRERDRRRALGDHAFLGRLRDAVGDLRPLESLNERELEDVVDDTERAMWDDRWRLTGEETAPIRERLDQHFAKPQAAWVVEQERMARQREERERQAAAEQLDVLRREILAGRQILEDTEARLKAFEDQLEQEAAAQGVQAWPA